ncbi:MAG: hypothetical protein J7K04_10765, partial [Spirochaetales bacterium]|nr:hypothetical protein [Spirochaetales bacterium]
MNLSKLKKFAQNTRKKLLDQIAKRLDYILSHDDEYLRAHSIERDKIGKFLKEKGRDQFLEEVAYTWFNRFTALRFMDARGYDRIRIVSPAEDETQIQLLAEIKSGNIPKELEPYKEKIFAYLNGKISSAQPDREVYQIALLAECNYLGSVMPFLFEKIHDWAALLLPLDLLSSESVIADFQREILPEDCKDVEIIGWLYQFYISEKKDQVISALKKNKKITKENIPPATQLFTPHWIVRYMVENSLGRLWLNNYPESSVKKRMEYYVKADREEDFIKINDPSEIRVLDPCSGSGHILVYAFDLLFDMYEEQGYSVKEIPALIVKNNLYGIDIDKRAASLTSFALLMKAKEKDRHFLERGIFPNVVYSEDVDVDLREIGISLSPELMISFSYLKNARNFGSLIPVSDSVYFEIREIIDELESGKYSGLFEEET